MENIADIRAVLAGVWHSSNNGNIWYFTSNYSEEEVVCYYAQRLVSLQPPIRFGFRIIEEGKNVYFEIDDQKFELLSINPTELIFIAWDNAPVRLTKNPFIRNSVHY